MKSCCKSLIVMVNSLTLIIGLVVIGFSIYGLVETHHTDSDLNSATMWVYWSPMIVGAVLSIVALVGCCTTLNENKCCMFIYGLIQFIIGLILVACGVFLILARSNMESVAFGQVNSFQYSSPQEYLNDYTTGAYQVCCDTTLSNVDKCPAATNDFDAYCYYDKDTYESGLDIDEGCQQVSKDQLLCPPSMPSSEGKGLKYFQESVYNDSESALFICGTVFIIFGAILLVCFVGSCYLVCCAPNNNDKKKPQQQNTGGPTTSLAQA